MKRKVTLSIAALLIVFDIGFTIVAFDAAGRRITAVRESVSTIVAFVRDYVRPIPKLDGLP
jgi:hypothetical protein